MRFWAGALLALLVNVAPFLAGFVIGLAGGFPVPPAEAGLAFLAMILVVAFAGGCLVSWIARVPLGPADYAWAACMVAAISASRILGAADPMPALVTAGLTFGAALVGALIAERTRAFA